MRTKVIKRIKKSELFIFYLIKISFYFDIKKTFAYVTTLTMNEREVLLVI